MSEWLAIPMLLAGGLFAGGVAVIAWERVPAWLAADVSEFRTAFAYTVRRVDRLQPALLVVCLVSTIGFVMRADGAARSSALFAAAGFLIVLVGSVALLIPVQRRLVAPGAQQPSEIERLRSQWVRGHVIRTLISLAALTLAINAIVR